MSEDNNIKNFEEVYITYFAKLRRFAAYYVLSAEEAENIVHDVFCGLWYNWETISGYVNLNAYLFMSVKNRCIDLLRRQAINKKAKEQIQGNYEIRLRFNLESLESLGTEASSFEDIERMIEEALAELPERCREVFIKHKFEGKKYKDIAAELNISVNTVENHMAVAYKKLRIHFKHLLPLLTFILS